MQPFGRLAFVGVVLWFVGVWAVVASALPSIGSTGAACAALQATALALAVISWRRARGDGDALAALLTSWAATLPGALLLIGVAARAAPRAGDLLLMVNLLWLPVAPYLFITSAVTCPLRSAWRSLTLARLAHVGAWLSSSVVAMSFWR